MIDAVKKIIEKESNTLVERCRKRLKESKNSGNVDEETGITSILKRKHGL